MKRIDEILSLPHSADDFNNQELPPSDDDSWLYGGEDELNAALQERQNEMDFFNSKQKKKYKSKEQEEPGSESGKDVNEYDLGGIAKSMQSFIEKMSSYKGAELPEDRCFLSLRLAFHLNVILHFLSYANSKAHVLFVSSIEMV